MDFTIIDTENLSTYPSCLADILDKYEPQLQVAYGSLNFIEPWKYERYIEPVREQYKLLEAITDEVLHVLLGYKITCYHSTRLLNLEDIKLKGLQVSDEEDRIIRLRSVMNALNFTSAEIDFLLKKCQFYWNRDSNRRNSIHFYSTNEISESYEHFAYNIGGEVVDFSLGDEIEKMPFSKLKNNGFPVTMKFICDFKSIDKIICQRKIVLGYVKTLIIYKLFNIQCFPRFDGWIHSNIPPEDIISINPITKFHWEE